MAKMKAKKRDALPDEMFGLPDQRKFPLNDKSHVKAAVRLFGKCPDEDKPRLARNILRRANELGMDSSGWKVVHAWARKKSDKKKDDKKEEDVKQEYVALSEFDHFFVESEIILESEYNGLYEQYLKKHGYDKSTNTIWASMDPNDLNYYRCERKYISDNDYNQYKAKLKPNVFKKVCGRDAKGYWILTPTKIRKRVSVGRLTRKNLDTMNNFLRDHKFNPDDDTILVDDPLTNTQRRMKFLIRQGTPSINADGRATNSFGGINIETYDPINLSENGIFIDKQFLQKSRSTAEGIFGHESGHFASYARYERDMAGYIAELNNIVQLETKAKTLPSDSPELANILKRIEQSKQNAIAILKKKTGNPNIGSDTNLIKAFFDEDVMNSVKSNHADFRKGVEFINKYGKQIGLNQHDSKPEENFADRLGEKIASKYTGKPTNPALRGKLMDVNIAGMYKKLDKLKRHPEQCEGLVHAMSGHETDVVGSDAYNKAIQELISKTETAIEQSKKGMEARGKAVGMQQESYLYLESEAKLPNGITLRKATKDDIDYIYECELQTVSADEKKDPNYRKEIEKDARDSVGHTKIIMINGYRMGIYQAYATNKWGLKEGEKDWWYIAEIYLSPSARGKGIGTSIIETDISNHDKLLLNVLKENRKAIKLYKRLGFKIDQEFDNRYIMRLEKSKTFQEGMVDWHGSNEPIYDGYIQFFGKRYSVDTYYNSRKIDPENKFFMNDTDWENLEKLYKTIESIFEKNNIRKHLISDINDPDYFPVQYYGYKWPDKETEAKVRKEDSEHPFDTLELEEIFVNTQFDDDIHFKYMLNCRWKYDDEHGYGFLFSRDLSECYGSPQLGGTDWESNKTSKGKELNHIQPVPVNLTLPFVQNIVKKIHDKTVKDKKPPTGNQNCMLCTWCFEAQCRGIDALPRPVYSPRDKIFSIKGEYIASYWTSKIRFKDKAEALSIVEKAGSNSRFWVHVNWKDSKGGHEFLLVNINSKVYIVDPQQGLVIEFGSSKNDYFDDINYDGSYMLRFDNQPLVKRFLDEATDESRTLPWDEKKDIPYMKEHGMLGDEDEEHAKKTGLITEAESDMIKVDNFKYNKVYYGAIHSGEKHRKLSSPLFVTPYIGIASIFAGREKLWPELRKRGVVGDTNLNYYEWGLPEKDLNKIFRIVHVTVQVPSSNTACKTDVEPFEIKLKGYIHTVDTTDLKNDIYQYKWMDKTREYLIDVPEIDIENVEEIETRYIVTVKRMTKEQDERYQSRHKSSAKTTQEQFIEEAYRDEHHNKLYFHLSPDSYLDGQVFKPRVPEYLDRYDPEDKNFENDTTPRVCFSPSIEGCLNGIQVNLPRVNVMSKTKFYVYIPEKPFHEYKHKTNKELIRDKDIFDASVTQEVWILEPVRMKLYGVIEIDSVTNVKRKQNVPTVSGKKSTRPYYKYKWHWLVKPKVLEKGTKFDYSVPRVIELLCMDLPKFRYGLIRDGRLQTGNVSESDYDKYWVVHSPEEIDQAGGGNCWDMVEWEAGYLDAYGVECNKYFLSMEHNKKIRTHTFIVVKDHGKFIYIEQAFKRVVDEIGNSKEFDKLEDIFDYVIEASMEFDNMKECNYGIWDYTDIKFKVGTPAKNFMDYIITNGENVYEGNKSNKESDSK